MIDNDDGTITDSATELMWERAGSDTKYNHDAAVARCGDLTLAGHTDWRLPTIRELISIVDYERRNLAIHPAFKTAARFYWSATTFAMFPDFAWYVDFFNGFVGSGNKDFDFYVRAVRTGSSKEKP